MAQTTTPPVSDEARVRAALLHCSHQGNWNGILDSLDELSRINPPHHSAALHDRARTLEEALTTAKAIRADLAASLVRLTAAARFADRQNPGELSEF